MQGEKEAGRVFSYKKKHRVYIRQIFLVGEAIQHEEEFPGNCGISFPGYG